jgi:hypothetical protein
MLVVSGQDNPSPLPPTLLFGVVMLLVTPFHVETVVRAVMRVFSVMMAEVAGMMTVVVEMMIIDMEAIVRTEAIGGMTEMS